MDFNSFFTVLFLFSSASALHLYPCDLNDYVCTTQAAIPIYHNVIDGVPEMGISPNDPIRRDVIHAVSQRLNYTLTNVLFYGLKHCTIHQLKFNLDESTWEYYLTCPRLILEANYEMKGEIMSFNVEGHGPCRVIYDNYLIGLTGGMQFYNGADGDTYIHVTDFKTSHLEVRGLATYQFNNLYNTDPERAFIISNILNANWQRVTKATQEPAVYALFETLMEGVNKYLQHAPVKQLFARSIL